MGDPMVTLEAPPPFVVVPATKAPRIGSFRGHLPPVDLRPLGLGVAYRITHHKRWIYVAIATDTLLACVAVANLGYVANSFVFVLDHARDGLLGIDDGRGLRLRVAAGTVWLTQQGDGRDVVLREGESFVIERPGRTVVQALDPAELALNAANDNRYSTDSRPLFTKGAA